MRQLCCSGAWYGLLYETYISGKAWVSPASAGQKCVNQTKPGGKAGRSDSSISEKASLMGSEDGPEPAGWSGNSSVGSVSLKIRARP